VFHHVEAGGIAEQPAGKDPAPLRLRIGIGSFANRDLDESARFRRVFPRGGAFTRREAQDDIAEAARFARAHFHFAGDVVALVQQAERGNAFLKRGRAAIIRIGGHGGPRARPGQFFRHFRRFFLLFGRAAIAAREKQQGGKTAEGGAAHHASGAQAS